MGYGFRERGVSGLGFRFSTARFVVFCDWQLRVHMQKGL